MAGLFHVHAAVETGRERGDPKPLFLRKSGARKSAEATRQKAAEERKESEEKFSCRVSKTHVGTKKRVRGNRRVSRNGDSGTYERGLAFLR